LPDVWKGAAGIALGALNWLKEQLTQPSPETDPFSGLRLLAKQGSEIDVGRAEFYTPTRLN